MKTFSCTKCPLSNPPCVWGEGPTEAKVVIIGEALGQVEYQQGRPFVGPAGLLLMHIISKLGLKREDFYLANVLKCYPMKKLPGGDVLQTYMDACAGYLDEELRALGRETIVLLGGTALRSFTGNSQVSKFDGMEVQQNIWATYHPAFVLRNPAKKTEVNIYRIIYKACRRAGLPVRRQGWRKGFYRFDR